MFFPFRKKPIWFFQGCHPERVPVNAALVEVCHPEPRSKTSGQASPTAHAGRLPRLRFLETRVEGSVLYSTVTILFFITAFFFQQSIAKELTSAITSVTIYSDRASVTRTAKITLQQGKYSLAFSHLPITLIDGSVRVSGEAEGASILNVRVETAFLDTIPEMRIRSLQEQLQTHQARLQEINDRITVVNAEKDFVLQIKAQTANDISRDLKVQRPTVEDWTKILVFIDSNLNKFLAELRSLNKDRSDISAKIEALQRQINAIGPGSHRAAKNIIVDLQVSKPGDIRLETRYVVPGARWYPAYDVRVQTESQSVDLNYFGTVQQNTGEDWSNVALSLSTARPDVGGKKPELVPWYLDLKPPMARDKMQKKGEIESDEVALLALQPQEAGVAKEMAAIEAPVALIESQTTSALFRIPAQSTVPADNTPQKVTITRQKLAAEFSYASVPKLSPYVFLKASVKNSSEFPLLAGTVMIFSNDEFVGSSSVPLVAPGEIFDASLGIDPGFRIERKLLNKTTEYVGTFSKNIKMKYDYRFTLENLKQKEQHIRIEDQLPISRNEKIIVEQLEPAAQLLPKNDLGILTWDVVVKAGEKREWKLLFTVEYPQGAAMIGLE